MLEDFWKLMNHNFCTQNMLKELNEGCSGVGDEDDANDDSDASFLIKKKQLVVIVCAKNNYLYLEIVQKKPKHINTEYDKLTYIIDFVAGSR